MRLAVFSDSHGFCASMISAVRAYGPDMILHLGDYSRDAEELIKEFPSTPVKAVKGNCDFASQYPENELFSVEDKTIFMTHGHKYNVKFTLDSMLNSAHFAGADIVLFGHTHKALVLEAAGMRVMNPGTAGTGREPSWAKLEIPGDGTVKCEIVRF